MSRYVIYAKRKDETTWSEWTTTDDINALEKHVDRIRELGYDAKIADPKIEEVERKLASGHLLETPVAIGQTVYAVTPDKVIEKWEVKAILYDGEKWYAEDSTGALNIVGSNWCLTGIIKAKRVLKKLMEETENET